LVKPKDMKTRILLIFLTVGSLYTHAQNPGCIDPEALNYNPNVLFDNGNCVYEQECLENKEFILFTFGFGGPNIGSEIVLTDITLQDTLASFIVTFNIFYFGACLDMEQCYVWHVTRTEQSGTYSPTGWVMMQDVSGAYLGDSYSAPGQHYRMNFSPSGNYCGTPGCLDEIAMNYYAAADVDFGCVYCQDNLLKLYSDNLFSATVNWSIYKDDLLTVSGGFSQFSPTTHKYVCLTDGCYELRLNPNQGSSSSWMFNNLYMEDMDGTPLAHASLSQGVAGKIPFAINTTEICHDTTAVYGCNNPLAANYNPTTTIYNGSCDLDNDLCNFAFDFELHPQLENTIKIVTQITSPTYPIYIFWTFGDGNTPIESLWPTFTFAADEPLTVCARMYVFDWSAPYCVDQHCFTFVPEEFGFVPGTIVTIGVPEGTSVQENETVGFNCFPNPTNDILHVELSENSSIFNQIEILDVTGRQVISRSISGQNQFFQIDVSGLKEGLYFIRLSGKEKQAVQRMIKL
jgi:hypothetical protein